uniref:Pentatricopeptide repeat-containing protein n=1 Tax=Kalanchoe fedtschenkoi TaxID=63787 RepID=A0A7N0V161_KALFE
MQQDINIGQSPILKRCPSCFGTANLFTPTRCSNAIKMIQTQQTTDDVMIPLLLPTNFDRLCLLLHKCMKQKALRPGKQLHAVLLTSGVGVNDDNVNSKLVGVYASCSDLKSAEWVFSETLNPNVFALNWMVSASAFHGLYSDAVGYFQLMQEMKMSPNLYTLYSVLKACVGLMDVRNGKEVHAVVLRKGFDDDILLSNDLIDMYCKCENLRYARKVFDKMTSRDVITWTISGH